MKVITPGHKYEVANFENKDAAGQVIQFIHKAQLTEGPELTTLADGTTNEELLAVLIDRVSFLNDKFPCRENSIAITKMQEAAMWLYARTIDREKRKVEGKNLK